MMMNWQWLRTVETRIAVLLKRGEELLESTTCSLSARFVGVRHGVSCAVSILSSQPFLHCLRSADQ